MTTAPQDPAAAGRDQLRVGHAERDQVIETLKTAFVHGRLTKGEFDARAGRALAARTHADLAALTADIPAVPAAAGTPRPAGRAADVIAWPTAPARRRPLTKASAVSGGMLAFAFGLILFAANVLDPDGLGNPYHPWSRLCAGVAILTAIAAVMVFVHGVGTSVEQRRARRQLPPRPGPGGHAPDGTRHGGTGPGPVPPAPRINKTRVDLRIHRSRPRRRHVPAQAGRGVRPVTGPA